MEIITFSRFTHTLYNRLNSPITLEELEVGCMTELGTMGPKQCQSHGISRQCCLSKMGIAMEYITARLELFNSNSILSVPYKPAFSLLLFKCMYAVLLKQSSKLTPVKQGHICKETKPIEDAWPMLFATHERKHHWTHRQMIS